MDEPATVPDEVVRNPLVYSGSDLADRALSLEWLETDGLGGFACGTAAGARTRKYHGWYAPAIPPPRKRWMLVSGCEEFVRVGAVTTGISTQVYRDATFPEGRASLTRFALEPFPTWLHETDRFSIERSLCLPRGRSMTIVSWTNRGSARAELRVRPLLAFRGIHELQRENGFSAKVEIAGDRAIVRPDGERPPLFLRAPRATGVSQPDWFRHFLYTLETERGYDAEEDLWSPLSWTWQLAPGATAHLVLSTEETRDDPAVLTEFERRRRDLFPKTGDPTLDELARRAESFLVELRDGTATVLAGFPWFADWGRDAFCAAPGLAAATGRYRPFARALNCFAGHLSGGLLPNTFPNDGEEPEYNAIDAPLWFVLAVEAFGRLRRDPTKPSPLVAAVRDVIQSYRNGTRFGIGVGADLLVSGAEPGRALTWMDAVVDGEPVTPRRGRPVEVNAL